MTCSDDERTKLYVVFLLVRKMAYPMLEKRQKNTDLVILDIT